mgnify:CR=1 FL=1
MNKLFSIFAYGLVAMVISLATSLQAAPNEAYPGWKVSTTKDWQGFISKSKGIKVADGHAIAQKREVSFTSKLKKFAKPAKLRETKPKDPRFLSAIARTSIQAESGQSLAVSGVERVRRPWAGQTKTIRMP